MQTPTDPASPYGDLHGAMTRLDQRNTRYRFDLEGLPWDQGAMQGLHLPPRLLTSMGIDAEALSQHPDAWEMFQWAAGLEICRSFSALEQYLVDFVDAERDVLGPTRSAEMLYEEEIKHVALFERYAELLLEARPAWADRFDEAFAPSMPTLLHPYTRDAYPDPAVQHYFFWIKTLFFEEYTLFLHEKLKGEPDEVCPLWLEAHRCHRMEETQHVITDLAHVEALDLSSLLVRACATTFWAHLEQTFDLFLGVSASRRMVRKAFPELAAILPDRPTSELPIFREVLGHRLFRGTRRCAPSSQFHPSQAPAPSEEAPARPALLDGTLLAVPEGTLVDALDQACATGRGITWVREGEPDRFESYTAVRERALHALDALSEHGIARGDHVVLRLERPEQAVPLLWACILGGRIPVLLAPPTTRDDDTEQRLTRVLERLGYPAVIAARGTQLDATRLLAHRADTLPEPSPGAPDAPALIQFSSGTTGDPKGVQLTHANLLANTTAIAAHLGARADDTFLSWLPLHHDMGLIGYHFLPIVLGVPQVLMHPRHFLKRPADWLHAIHRHRACVSASPTFGLQTTADRARDTALDGVDLSSLRTLLLGAEPISGQAMRRFAERFADWNLSAQALTPGYGLAESTLCVTGRRYGAANRSLLLDRDHLGVGAQIVPALRGLEVVSCGTALPGAAVRVVDDGDKVVPAGVVGRIQTRGLSVTPGFYGDDPRPDDAFAGDWLRTGDLGFIDGDELFVTGRAKEVLFLHGTKRYAYDIETALHGVEGLHPRRIVAFGAFDHELGRDRMCVAATMRPRGRTRAEIAEEIAATVATRFGRRPDVILDLPAAQIPRTTSGKLQRHVLRERLERGDLAAFEIGGGLAPRHARLLRTIRKAWATALEIDEDRIGLDDDFRVLGGSSIQAAMVHAVLEDELARPIPHEVLLEAATVRDMADALRVEAKVRVEVTAEVARPIAPRGDDIAVIGLGLRMPGVDTPEELWELVLSGKDRFAEVPSERWDHARQIARDPSLCPTGAFVDHVFDFDPSAFGLDAAQGAAMEPRQRLFLEAAERALRHAGVASGHVGTFVSAGENPLHARSFLDDLARGDVDMTGRLENGTNNIVAARVNKAFGFTGPAVMVQAACASSLVAIHHARRAIQLGECDVAIAGGVEIAHSPTFYALFGPNRVLSRQGRCRPFTEAADGFVPGEGAGAVVLKRLSQAEADGDRVLAVIRGSAVTNDGQSFSGLAPNPRGQMDAARRALAEADIDASAIGLIEAHGTATPIGDAVELKAMRTVYPTADAAVSSVKSNLGHLLAAAGVAAFAKTVLALHHGVAPPIAGFGAPDPRLGDLREGPRPIGDARPLADPRIAAINALGIGGTNCHMVLTAPPSTRATPSAQETPIEHSAVVSIGARSEALLVAEAETLADALPSADNAAITAALARRARPASHRRAAVVPPGVSPAEALRALGHRPTPAPTGKVAVVFPGPGARGRFADHALRQDGVFADAYNQVGKAVSAAMGETLGELEADASRRIDAAQPAVFALSWATWRWLNALGLEPDAVLGHSAGEYAALVAAGAWPLQDALTALLARGDAMAAAPAGRMIAAMCTADQARALCPDLEVACINAPAQVVLSGADEAIARAESALAAADVRVRTLDIPCAAHSVAMEAAQPRLGQALTGQAFQAPSPTMYSTRTGERLDRVDADYLVAQLRDPVRFQAAVDRALDDGVRTFVEVGASAILSPAIQAIAAARGVRVHTVATHHVELGDEGPLHAAATLFELGLPVRLQRLGNGDLPLPAPAHRRQHLPMAFAEQQAAAVGPGTRLAGEVSDAERAVFADHRADDEAIAPAAWMFEQLFSALGPGSLEGLAITAPVRGGAERWRVERHGDEVRFLTEVDGNTQVHVSGRFTSTRPPVPTPDLTRSGDHLPPETVYDGLASGGLSYGPTLRAVDRVDRDGDTVWVELSPRAPLPARWVDPSLLDGAFQALVTYLLDSGDRRPMLGFAARRITAYHPTVGPCRARIDLRHLDANGLRADLTLVDALGRTTLVIEDFAARRLERRQATVLALGRTHVPRTASADRPQGPVAVLGAAADGAAVSTDLLGHGIVAMGPLPLDHAAVDATLSTATSAVLLGPSLADVHRLAEALGELKTILAHTEDERVAAMLAALGAESGTRVSTLVGGQATPQDLWCLLHSGDRLWLATDAGWSRRSTAPPTAADAGIEGPVWVVGATGGIGHAIASRLAAQGIAVALSGRRDALPASQQATLESHGAAFAYAPADLASASDVALARATLEDALGPVRTLIHAAGTRRDGPLSSQRWDDIDAVLTAKTVGVDHLAKALSGDALTRVILVSSLSSVVPSPGQAAYAAANAALDAAVHAFGDDVRAQTLGFGPWRDVGMVADEDHTRLAAAGLPPMSTSEAVDGFFAAAATEESHLAVARLTSNGQSRLAHAVHAHLEPAAAAPTTPPSKAPQAPPPPRKPSARPTLDAGPLSLVEQALAPRLKAPFSADATFAELGIDSLGGVEIVRALEARMGVPLHPTLLFEHPTPRLLAEALTTRAPAPTRSPEPRVTRPPVAAPSVATRPEGRVAAWQMRTSDDGVHFEPTEATHRPLDEGEVRIAADAWGVNFIDVLGGVGLHPVLRGPRFVPGHEVEGTVTEVAPGVTRIRVGQRVAALVPSGGYAREVVAPAGTTTVLPSPLSPGEGVSVLITGLTALACIEDAGRVRAGDKVLVQSASGATGTACVQLAAHAGATIFGTASTADKREHLELFGVRALPYERAGEVAAEVGGYDVIVDSLAGEAIAEGIGWLADGGRFVEVGAGASIPSEGLDPQAMFLKNQSFLGVNLSQITRDPARTAELFRRWHRALELGALRPAVGHRVPFSDAPAAHRLLRERRSIGKILLEP